MPLVPFSNRLVDGLPPADRRDLLAAGTSVDLRFGKVLHSRGEALADVYFPTRGFISLIMAVGRNTRVEVGLVGSEGMFGVPLALGVAETPMSAVVQGAGTAITLTASAFLRTLASSRALALAIDRYACVHLGQLAQTAGCTRFHLVEGRLARWLLMTQDRADAKTFPVTHQFLGDMLGVRRAGVTIAAGALQRRGLIHYRRGSVTILDRRKLKAAACGCYEADRLLYRRILG